MRPLIVMWEMLIVVGLRTKTHGLVQSNLREFGPDFSMTCRHRANSPLIRRVVHTFLRSWVGTLKNVARWRSKGPREAFGTVATQVFGLLESIPPHQECARLCNAPAKGLEAARRKGPQMPLGLATCAHRGLLAGRDLD